MSLRLAAGSLLAFSLLASLGLFTTESKASTTSQPDPVELQGIAAFHRPFMTYSSAARQLADG